MKRSTVAALALATSLALAGTANATTIVDPVGDFAATYTGPRQADLDVTSFSVTYNATLRVFLLQSTMAGIIDPALGGFYAIGVNTGTGPSNFASIGLAGVRFNQVISVQKNGTATIGGVALAAGSVTIGDNALSVLVPVSLLPTTGFDPTDYGFNIWPRSGAGGTNVISDFSPDNATISASGIVAGVVPEPASWLLMVTGFGVCGAAVRRSRRVEPARLATV